MNVLKNVDEGENPIDSHYKSLRCDLQLVKKESNDFKASNSWNLESQFLTLHIHIFNVVIKICILIASQFTFHR